MAIEHNGWTIYRGGTRTWRVTVKDAAGEVMNLTGCTVRYYLAPSREEVLLLDLGGNSGVTVLDALSGLVQVVLDETATADLPPGPAVHELVVTDAEGGCDVVLQGRGYIHDTLIPES